MVFFPQLKGLGYSEMSAYYGIDGIEEVREYYGNEILKERLIKITEALLELNECDPIKIFGVPDNYKLCSSMTLFNFVAKDTDIFGKVIDKFFAGKKDEKTLKMLEGNACM